MNMLRQTQAEGAQAVREVLSECPRCGRRTHRKVDAWAGLPDASLDLPCEGGCKPLPAATALRSRADGRSSAIPLLFAVALVAAPVVGVIEALSR